THFVQASAFPNSTGGFSSPTADVTGQIKFLFSDESLRYAADLRARANVFCCTIEEDQLVVGEAQATAEWNITFDPPAGLDVPEQARASATLGYSVVIAASRPLPVLLSLIGALTIDATFSASVENQAFAEGVILTIDGENALGGLDLRNSGGDPPRTERQTVQ